MKLIITLALVLAPWPIANEERKQVNQDERVNPPQNITGSH